MDFYEKHALVQPNKVQWVDKITRRDEQADFIHMMSVNHQEVAFLGDEMSEKDMDRLNQHFCRVDKMVIPQYAQMVNVAVLRAEMEKQHVPNSTIDTSDKDFFYNRNFDESVLLNVCGKISKKDEAKNFHHCAELHELAIGKWYNNCGLPSLNFHFLDDKSEDGEIIEDKIQNELTLFYISVEDMHTSDLAEIEEEEKEEQHKRQDGIIPVYTPILSRLKQYYKSTKRSKGLKWKSIKGAFLIPVLYSNQSIIYYCILNIEGEQKNLKSTRESLQTWLSAVDNYNNKGAEFGVAMNILLFCGIDNWSTFITNDAEPVPLKKD